MNNNNPERLDHQYELQGFFVNQQQQQQSESESNFVKPNSDEDFLKQLADLTDGRIHHVEPEFREQEHGNEEQDEEVDEINLYRDEKNLPMVPVHYFCTGFWPQLHTYRLSCYHSKLETYPTLFGISFLWKFFRSNRSYFEYNSPLAL